MSTIEKILESLGKTCSDKKNTLDRSYQEKSFWLKNEFDVIRNLIKQNPRENLEKEQAMEEENCAPAANSSSSVPKTGVSASGDGEESSGNRKRKSSEVGRTANGPKYSPEQKRCSIGVEDLLVAAGLPTDLNRLTKEKLLTELEKRGQDGFTMKSLKKDLVDGLRDAMMDEYRSATAAAESEAECSNDMPLMQTMPAANKVVQTVDATAVAPPVTAAPTVTASLPAPLPATASTAADMPPPPPLQIVVPMTTPSKPAPQSARKGSLMSDIRSLVAANGSAALNSSGPLSITNPNSSNSNGAASVCSTPSDKSRNIESEFQARQSRHRDSVARKSLATAAPAAVVPTVATAVPAVVSAPVPAAAETMDEQDDEEVVGAKNGTVSAPKDSISSEDSIWMDVSSPTRSDAPSKDSLVPATSTAASAAAVEAPVAPVASVNSVTTATSAANRARGDSDASAASVSSMGSAKSFASASSGSGAQKHHTAGTASSSAGAHKSVVSQVYCHPYPNESSVLPCVYMLYVFKWFL
jgi:hypothetical protein